VSRAACAYADRSSTGTARGCQRSVSISPEVDVERSGRFELRLSVGNESFDVLSVAQDPDYLVEVDGAVHAVQQADICG
jgi:hypothetical protein